MHLFFYNPNIHPEEEYLRRKQELIRYAQLREIQCIDTDYTTEEWFEAIKGFENEPECGRRCELCFELRLRKTAQYAALHGYGLFATTLAMSSKKRMDQITAAGRAAAASFPDSAFLDYPWRRGGLVQEMSKIVTDQKMYRQNYCGCLYSKKGERR